MGVLELFSAAKLGLDLFREINKELKDVPKEKKKEKKAAVKKKLVANAREHASHAAKFS